MSSTAPVQTDWPSQATRAHTIGKPAWPATNGAPPLERGDHLSRAEFERRYAAMPYVKKAELIEGVVARPSPVHYLQHSRPHGVVMA